VFSEDVVGYLWTMTGWLFFAAGAVLSQCLGARLCSMFLEDAHHTNQGRYLTAFLRPGFLEAGFQSALVIWCFLSTFRGSASSLRDWMALSDVVLVSYYVGLLPAKLSCVVYGCCWGVQLKEDKWWATKYTNPVSKVLRMRPDLKGQPLFPVSTLMSLLFFKNALLCMVYVVMLPYVPGILTFLMTLLNRVDKNIYFALRGDSGGGSNGHNDFEDFRMVEASEKKTHCLKWARPTTWNSCAAICNTVLVVGKALTTAETLDACVVRPLEAAASVPWLNIRICAGLLFAFMLGLLSFGYHYKYLGVWLPRGTCRDKKAR